MEHSIAWMDNYLADSCSAGNLLADSHSAVDSWPEDSCSADNYSFDLLTEIDSSFDFVANCLYCRHCSKRIDFDSTLPIAVD